MIVSCDAGMLIVSVSDKGEEVPSSSLSFVLQTE